MARINIEDRWWSDPRRMKLILRIGFSADAAAVNMWRTAQEFWGRNHGLIPKSVFDALEFSRELLECGLATLTDPNGRSVDVAERSEAFVYVRGSSEHLGWLHEQREKARAAGKKSAEMRKKKAGSAQPKGGRGFKKPNDNRTASEQEPNASEPSGSGSISFSSSNELEKREEANASSLAPAKVSRIAQTKNAPQRFESDVDVLRSISDETRRRWMQLYPDPEFLKREALKAFGYYENNPHKRPTSARGWSRALGAWFDRGWPRHVAQKPANGASHVDWAKVFGAEVGA